MNTKRQVIEELIAEWSDKVSYVLLKNGESTSLQKMLQSQLDDEPEPAEWSYVRDLIDPLKYKFNNSPLQKGEPKGGDDDQGEE